jgi:hypothetical protein
VLATPGISAVIAAAMGPGVLEKVFMVPLDGQLFKTIYRRSFFTFTLSKFTSSSTHKNIRPVQAIPIASPNMFKKLYVLFFNKLRIVVLKKLLNM